MPHDAQGIQSTRCSKSLDPDQTVTHKYPSLDRVDSVRQAPAAMPRQATTTPSEERARRLHPPSIRPAPNLCRPTCSSDTRILSTAAEKEKRAASEADHARVTQAPITYNPTS